MRHSPRSAADAGARLLDTAGPDGWFHEVDLDRLKMRSSRDCVLGQLYGYYFTGCRFIGIAPRGEAAVELGFIIPGFCASLLRGYARLERAWKREIASRRAAAAKAA